MSAMQSATMESAVFSPGGSRGPRLDKLLVGTHRQAVLKQQEQYLSKNSNVEVFEAGKRVSRRKKMDDDDFITYLQGKRPLLPEEVQFRCIFIPDMPDDTDKLQLTAKAFELLLDRFEIGNRFAAMIQAQFQPSKQIEYDHDTMKPTRLQFMWSHIVRKIGAALNPKDATKRVLDWRRLIVWNGRDMRTGVQTMVILRLPADTQERWLNMVGDDPNGHSLLLRFPMLMHGFIVEDLITRSKNFSQDFAAPMYGMELKLGHTATDITANARRFLTMSRQIGNVLIDYDIIQASLVLLQETYAIIKSSEAPSNFTPQEWKDAHVEFDGKVFEVVHLDYDLMRKYGQLYFERTQLGNTECQAMINQREVEISKQMSAESTVMARAAHQDGQSLRIIQYLGLIFLPFSLCTSVFGMGFFSTEIDNEARAILYVSNQWWWFLALSIPFTLVCLVVTWGLSLYSVKKADVRKKSQDLERLLSYEIDEQVSTNMDKLTTVTSQVAPDKQS